MDFHQQPVHPLLYHNQMLDHSEVDQHLLLHQSYEQKSNDSSMSNSGSSLFMNESTYLDGGNSMKFNDSLMIQSSTPPSPQPPPPPPPSTSSLLSSSIPSQQLPQKSLDVENSNSNNNNNQNNTNNYNNIPITTPNINRYNSDQMQEFLLKKFSSQDFDLLTKNYDSFLQYYKAQCQQTEQITDDKHLTMDFLSQFYHLNEFKNKLTSTEMEQDSIISDDDGMNDDMITLDDMSKDVIDFKSGDLTTCNSSINNYNSSKRLRTTILPEQLNFLYECYQTESNPSRKMLEEISKKVNLKKRVVQVSNLKLIILI